jgi:hypothetical protein
MYCFVKFLPVLSTPLAGYCGFAFGRVVMPEIFEPLVILVAPDLIRTPKKTNRQRSSCPIKTNNIFVRNLKSYTDEYRITNFNQRLIIV